jgi:hypothetical protein
VTELLDRPIGRLRGIGAAGPFYRAWWFRVLVVFLASRVVTTILLLILASVQGMNPWTAAHPGYFDFATIWDGRWYEIVSLVGYPSHLPVDVHGAVQQNAWAFLPAYPYLVNAVVFVTRLPWSAAAVLISAAFGLGASLIFYRLLRRTMDASTSLFAVVLFCTGPASPLFQLAYAESMYMFLLVLALDLLVTRRYLLLLPVIAVMAFTRPSGLAFALLMGLHVLYRWFARKRDPFPVRERMQAVGATLFSVLAGFAWSGIAALVTGNLQAYTDTELSWRTPYIGATKLMPFSSWIEGAHWWFVVWLGLPAWLGYATLAVVVALFASVLFLPSVKRLGVDVRLWLASYGAYVLAVFFPQSSTFRILMPMFPLAGAIAQPKSRVYRVVVVAVFIAAQLGWLLICWGIDGADWTPP